MVKKIKKTDRRRPIDLENEIPDPLKLNAVAQNVDIEDLDPVALRRGKVRELHKMGYNADQIAVILEKGILINRDTLVKVPCQIGVIKKDIIYILNEDAAIDIDFGAKRAEIIGKLEYLYNLAIKEYMDSTDYTRNSFLNTALSVLNKLSALEGVENKAVPRSDDKTAEMAKVLRNLKDGEKAIIGEAIGKILEGRKDGGSEESPVPPGTS